MPKILVTGANGFVGKHLVKELSGSGLQVLSVCGPGPSIKSETALSLDLAKPGETDKINFQGVSGVIHLAGLAAVGPSFSEPMRYIDVNMGIQINLYESVLKQDVKPRFLVVSSGTLYDSEADLPLHENSPVLPSSPYAVSKLGQEQISQYYNQRGIESIVVRPFNHVGPGQGPGFIVPDLVQQVVKCEQGGASEVLVGNLDAKRDYTDVRDIVRAYRLLLEKGKPGETYNICSGRALSGHEILEAILNLVEVNIRVEEDEARLRPSDNPVVYGSNEKLAKAVGWRPEIDIKKTLADVIDDWRTR